MRDLRKLRRSETTRKASEDGLEVEMATVMAMKASEIKECLSEMGIGTTGVYEVRAHAVAYSDKITSCLPTTAVAGIRCAMHHEAHCMSGGVACNSCNTKNYSSISIT